MRDMPRYCYVYVLHSLADHQFYVCLTRDLRARLHSHTKGLIASTKRRIPFQLVYWEGCLNDSDAPQREKYRWTAIVDPPLRKATARQVADGTACKLAFS